MEKKTEATMACDRSFTMSTFHLLDALSSKEKETHNHGESRVCHVCFRSAVKYSKEDLRVQKQVHSSIQLILEVAASVLSESDSNSAPCLSSQAIVVSLCKPMRAYASRRDASRHQKHS